MNSIKSYAVFRAEFPDDSTEVNGEVAIPAGRNIMEAIRQQLEATGFTVTQPTQHSFYGWAIEFPIGKANIWMLLQEPGPWLLIAEARASWLTGSNTKTEALWPGLESIENALARFDLVKEVRWMTQWEFEEFKRSTSQSRLPPRGNRER